jgi:hypothetical protein
VDMIIAALVVGGFTAFYFGVRPGVMAAGAAFAAFLAASIVPGLTFWSYALVGSGLVGVLTLGPRRADPTHAARASKFLGRGIGLVRGYFGKGKKRG